MVSLFELTGKEPPTKEVADRAFDWFMHTLHSRISKIHRVRCLYLPGPGAKVFLYGLQVGDRIYIDHACDKETAIRTLIHELAHFIFDLSDKKTMERKIQIIERRLWKAFSDEQKEALWLHVPKKITIDTIDNEPKQ